MATNERINALYDVLLALKTREDCQKLFDDLCTYREVENMADRIYAAKLLMSGMTYVEVIEQSGLSSATVSRVSRSLKCGKGYSTMLQEKCTSQQKLDTRFRIL